jgi:aminoglycoside 3-N-acetyltransferase I
MPCRAAGRGRTPLFWRRADAETMRGAASPEFEMASFHVRQLGPDDHALMSDLMTLFGDAFDDPETYTGARPGKPYTQRLLGRDSFVALVATNDGEVIGGLTAYELVKFERERSEFYIYDLAVARSRRRMGVATALIAALKSIAVRRGVYVIFVQADHGDDPAIALYSKLGTREDVLHFDIAAE